MPPSAYRTHGLVDAGPKKEHRAGSSDANLLEVAFLTVGIESEAEEVERNGHAGNDGTDIPGHAHREAGPVAALEGGKEHDGGHESGPPHCRKWGTIRAAVTVNATRSPATTTAPREAAGQRWAASASGSAVMGGRAGATHVAVSSSRLTDPMAARGWGTRLRFTWTSGS
jgi:hypothetical protein